MTKYVLILTMITCSITAMQDKKAMRRSPAVELLLAAERLSPTGEANNEDNAFVPVADKSVVDEQIDMYLARRDDSEHTSLLAQIESFKTRVMSLNAQVMMFKRSNGDLLKIVSKQRGEIEFLNTQIHTLLKGE